MKNGGRDFGADGGRKRIFGSFVLQM